MPGASRLRSLAAAVARMAAASPLIAGCSGSGGPARVPDSGGDAGFAPDASCGHGQPLSDAMAICTPLCNTAPVVSVVRSTGPVSPATGGTIVPGLYYVTAVTDYFPADAGVEAGTSTQTVQETVSIRASSSANLATTTGARNGSGDLTFVYQLTTVGSSLHETQVCPASTLETDLPYSASSVQLVVDLAQTSLADASVERKVLTLRR